MGKKYKTSYSVPFYETDINQQIKLPHLLSLALQVSSQQSLDLGISDDKIFSDYNLVWIVTEYKLDIVRLPHYAEKIEIETEAVAYNKLFCYRDFIIYGEEGEKIVAISSTFVLLDFDSRKAVQVPDGLVAPYESEKIKKVQRGPRFQHLENPTEHLTAVRFFDLDMNGHVNNSKYLEWMYDALEPNFLNQHIPQTVALKYTKEIHQGSTVYSRAELDGLISRHEITTDGIINAQALIEWRKKD